MARILSIVAAVAMLAASAVAQTTTTTTAAPTPACSCNKLSVDYSNDLIPEATTVAYPRIWLDTNDWSVYFGVYNVESITNGHVIAAPVDTQVSAAAAFTPLVSAFDANNLWSPPECTLGAIDTPAGSLGMTTTWEASNCTKSYVVRYSLLDAAEQNSHCTLFDDNQGEIKVNCSMTLSTVRGYGATETFAFTAQETAFTAEITLNSYLNNEVEDLLRGALSKCSVIHRPFFRLLCRLLGPWTFEEPFSITQSPNWLDAGSCTQDITGGNTFVECDMNSNVDIENGDQAFAQIGMTPTGGNGDTMTFNVSTTFSRPYSRNVTVTRSLQQFIRNVYFEDLKYFYGTADAAKLIIEVVDTARLEITDLLMSNTENPKRKKDLFADPRFQTAINAIVDRFTVDFYPAAIREDSKFYRHGPHTVNATFRFSAARRAQDIVGEVSIDGMNIQGSEEDNSSSNSAAASSSSAAAGTALMAGVAVGAIVLVVGLIGATVIAYRRRRATEAVTKEENAVSM